MECCLTTVCCHPCNFSTLTDNDSSPVQYPTREQEEEEDEPWKLDMVMDMARERGKGTLLMRGKGCWVSLSDGGGMDRQDRDNKTHHGGAGHRQCVQGSAGLAGGAQRGVTPPPPAGPGQDCG
jgi:hypothetical protein